MLTYTKYNNSDFQIFFNLVKEDQVMKYISGHALDLDAAQKKFALILTINRPHPDLGYFIIRDNNTVIGECKLVNNRYEPTVFEIGYLLEEQYWGKGIGTKVCEYLLQLAYIIDANKDIIGIINPENKASKRLMQKFGFQTYFIGEEDGLPTEKLVLKNAK